LLGIKVKVDASKFGRRLAKLEAPLRARTPMLHVIGRTGVVWVQENIARRGAWRQPGGWTPLRPNTVAAKGHNRPLVDTGDLALSFRYTIFGGTVRIRSDSPIAGFHEFGTKGPYNIPRNPPMPAGKYLAFMTTGGMVFAKQVVHPGLPKRPMLPTVDQLRKVATIATRAYIEVATEYAKS
jgi:phage gpG-like protein